MYNRLMFPHQKEQSLPLDGEFQCLHNRNVKHIQNIHLNFKLTVECGRRYLPYRMCSNRIYCIWKRKFHQQSRSFSSSVQVGTWGFLLLQIILLHVNFQTFSRLQLVFWGIYMSVPDTKLSIQISNQNIPWCSVFFFYQRTILKTNLVESRVLKVIWFKVESCKWSPWATKLYKIPIFFLKLSTMW